MRGQVQGSTLGGVGVYVVGVGLTSDFFFDFFRFFQNVLKWWEMHGNVVLGCGLVCFVVKMCVCVILWVARVQKGYSWFGGASRNVWSRMLKNISVFFQFFSECSKMAEHPWEWCFEMWFCVIRCEIVFA